MLKQHMGTNPKELKFIIILEQLLIFALLHYNLSKQKIMALKQLIAFRTTTMKLVGRSQMETDVLANNPNCQFCRIHLHLMEMTL